MSISALSYDAEGGITIIDLRIDPKTFDGLHLKTIVDSVPIYIPLEYVLISAVGYLEQSVEAAVVRTYDSAADVISASR